MASNSITEIRQRIDWAHSWLRTFTQDQKRISDNDDFELVSDNEGESIQDVISLSSQDPLTSCADDDDDLDDDLQDTRSEALSIPCHCPSCGWPFPFCDLCETEHPSYVAHDQWYWEDPYNPSSSPKEQHISYELSGRYADHTFKDFRSPAKARKRFNSKKQKYFNHRFVKPGQKGLPHYNMLSGGPRSHWILAPILPETAEIVTMDKHELYREAQVLGPDPPDWRNKIMFKKWERRHPRIRRAPKYANCHAEKDLDDSIGLELYYKEMVYQRSEIYDELEWARIDFMILTSRSEWCEACDTHWSRCQRWGIVEVDQIDELVYEATASRRRKLNYAVYWKNDGAKQVPENRAPSVLEYGPMDWHPRGAFAPEDDWLSWKDALRKVLRATNWSREAGSWQTYSESGWKDVWIGWCTADKSHKR
ncbi:hypothetical protein HII31_07881 [Pseudocercospora fuligena]|uniref:Uncharacterized protein n=1 Tax=Pseudocercospora fuligena TaxID=685502 RepID=A0A8H6VHJ2_9PEZI|nr:hypothetical protein HII31_07881 [Pseudocercospora fuligena]